MENPNANTKVSKIITESDQCYERNNYRVTDQRLGAREASLGCQVILKGDDIRGHTGRVTRQEPSKYLRRGHCRQRAQRWGFPWGTPGAAGWPHDPGVFNPLLLAFSKDHGGKKKRRCHREDSYESFYQKPTLSCSRSVYCDQKF